MYRILFFLAALAVFHASAVYAEDEASPDKSGYTLFNPTPDDLMHDFSTDRPDKSSTAITVDAGHFQYETDIVFWSYDRYNAAQQTTSSLVAFDPVLKLGLTNNTDLEIALAPINYDHTTDRTTDTNSSAFGFGDVIGRVKFNLFGNDGGNYALAVVPYVKAPTAAAPIGNEHWEGGGYAPFTINLPDQWSVTLQTELDILENAALNGVHPNYQNLVNVSRPITDTISGQAELWSDVNADKDSPTQYTFDLAALWAITGNLQLDAGTYIGLNKAAPDLQLMTGISQRF